MINQKKCCGCTACQHTCPTKCITMQEDDEGFLYPVINEEKCIRCYQCEKVCPVIHPVKSSGKTETFVGYSNNEEVRKNSSSGGIFSVIAEWILQQNGVVFGAAFDEDFEVHHIAIKTKEELTKIRGSKYVQSRMENIYPEVKKYLENEYKVLFTGTACQIAGLMKYLNKTYDKLYTIDVLCHGVPSPKIWRMYLNGKKKQFHSSIEKIEFRNKKNGWKNYSVNILFSSQQSYFVHYFNDEFIRMFLENIDLRPSCYACPFKEFPRISDMTIGDCWGIENYMPDMDDDQGTSIIMIHSKNGKKLWSSIRKNLMIKEADMDKALPSMSESRRSVQKHPNRKKFWKGVNDGESINELCRYVEKNFIQKVTGLIKYMTTKIKIKKHR